MKGESISQRVHMIQNLFSEDEFPCNTETSRQGYKASVCNMTRQFLNCKYLYLSRDGNYKYALMCICV